jgi:hypothetical protein
VAVVVVQGVDADVGVVEMAQHVVVKGVHFADE